MPDEGPMPDDKMKLYFRAEHFRAEHVRVDGKRQGGSLSFAGSAGRT